MNDNLEESADLTQKINTDSIVDETEVSSAAGVVSDHVSETVVPDQVPEMANTEEDIQDEMSASSEVNQASDAETQDSKKDDAVESSSAEVSGTEKKEPIAKKDWYILKVQVNREDSIKRRLEERVRQTGLEKHIEQILVPTEKVTTVKNGKKRVVKRKLYPGYLVVNMEINDDTWYLVRETAGIGDFTGAAGKPVPMLAHEVQRILQAEMGETQEAPKLKIPYEVGDMVKINDGTFKEIEGEVSTIDEVTGRVTVIITIFARSTPVELEYWQIEKVG